MGTPVSYLQTSCLLPAKSLCAPKGRDVAVGSKDSSSPSKGESKQSTKGQNCPPERLGTAFPGDTGRLSPSWRLLWVFPKPRMAGVYMDWASSAPFLHLSLVPTFPDLPDAHGPKRSLCLSLAQLISCHGQLWSTLPPARLLIPTCFLVQPGRPYCSRRTHLPHKGCHRTWGSAILGTLHPQSPVLYRGPPRCLFSHHLEVFCIRSCSDKVACEAGQEV